MTSPYNPADKLGKKLSQIEARLTDVEKAQSRSQLGKSSLDAGRILVKDRSGVVRQRIGDQGDGTYGVVDRNGPTPPTPTAPTVEPLGAALFITWNGQFNGGMQRPGDFRIIEVHAAATQNFTPTAESKRNVIQDTDGSGGSAVIEATEPLYVRLVAVTTSGMKSPGSTAVLGTPGPVVADDVLDGSITEIKIADDSITAPKIRAGAIEAGKLAADSVTASNIQAGSITAAKFAAELVLSSKFIAGTPEGERVEIGGNGIVQYGASGELLTRIGPSANANSNQLRVASGSAGAYVQVGPGAVIEADNPQGGRVELDADPQQPILRFWNTDRDRFGYINYAAFSSGSDGFSVNGPQYPLANTTGNPSGYARLTQWSGTATLHVVRAANESTVGGVMSVSDRNADLLAYDDSSSIKAWVNISKSGFIDFYQWPNGSNPGSWLRYTQDTSNDSPMLVGVNRDVGILFGRNGRLWVQNTANGLRDISCRSVSETSGKDAKTDFQPIPFDPLETVNAAPVEMWRYKDDTAEQYHVGPFADDLPEPLRQETDEAGLTVSPKSMIGTLWAAMQQISEKLDEISERLDKLEHQ